MDKQTAVGIIRDTFESPFDKTRFVYFIKNLLNKIDETKAFPIIQGHYIPESFRDCVKAYERIGTYTDPANANTKIDVLIVHLQREKSLERARTAQRNFVARYLKDRGEKEAGLVAFVSLDPSDWRFSLVKMEYHWEGGTKIRTEFTPARRWSFLVGENESSHTAQSQLVPILQDDAHDPALKQLEAAFNIEKVTKEFFEKYHELFLNVKKELDGLVAQNAAVKKEFTTKGVNTVDLSKKLLGQIVFLYFLQKKGWLGVPMNKNWGDGDRRFLRHLFETCNSEHKNFLNDYLEYLFYDALNNRDRGGVDPSYYSRFNCKIPFLNGGLFDPINNYDWEHVDIQLPNHLFSNTEKTKEGDTGTGILDVFDRYNFTVKEDEPLEKEVAIDPEMLGKVFENLLEVKDRKSKGTYYTPREIVHYMCQESLINYLDTAINTGDVSLVPTRPPQGKLFGQPDPEQTTLKTTGYRVLIPREDIEAFVHRGEFAVEHDSRVEAHGKETERYSYKLPESIRQNARLIDEKLGNVRVCDPAVGSGAFLVGMMTEVIRARNVLTTYIGDEKRVTKYKFKRHAIQNCLYGVDIDPGAVEIAKLRLWLSLVVDEEDIKQIQPLPNLDYKIVCGNSLLGVERNMFNNELFQKLEDLKPLYFNETNAKKKQGFRKQIDQLIKNLTNNKEMFDFEVYFSEVFHEKGGFDVVIANPPYISHDKIAQKDYFSKSFRCYEPFADIYCYFIELGIRLQNSKGLLCYITSNSYLKVKYGLPLRNVLRQKELFLELINIEDCQVFEAAIVNTAILLVLNRSSLITPQCLVVNATYDQRGSFQDFIARNSQYYSQTDFMIDPWSLASPERLKIKTKIEKAGVSLENSGAKIRLGLATGANEAFIVDGETRKLLIEKDPKNKEIIKPILKGRDIFRYKYRFNDNYILLTKSDINVKKDYPTIYQYLDSFGEDFRNRGARGDHWTNLRHCAFYDDFKREKIIWIELSDRGRFTLCDKEMYLLNTAYFLIPPKRFSAKYLIGILNSQAIEFYLRLIAETSGMGVTRWINEHVRKFPIPDAEESIQSDIADVVDNILIITGSEDYLSNPTKQVRVKEYERQIDQMVYELYGLTLEEIVVVEGSNTK
jgi:type I restriction-modification system DNA methylase subunit